MDSAISWRDGVDRVDLHDCWRAHHDALHVADQGAMSFLKHLIGHSYPLVLGALVIGVVPVEAGVIGVGATTHVHDAVGVSYLVRVEAQTSSAYGKILFFAHNLYNPSNCTGASCPQHQIEALIGNSTHAPQTGDCCWDGTGVPPAPPVCSAYNAAPFSGLKIGAWIGEKTAPAGLWMSDAVAWPRRALGIDGSLTAFKLEATYQRDVTGQDGRVEWRRGDLLPPDDLRNWGRSCLPMMQGRTMRQWHVTIQVGGEMFHGTAIYPEDEATHLRPDRLLELVTEFFELPGVVRIFVWDVQVERESGERVPLLTWTILSRRPGVPVGYWGVRKAEYAGGDVLEFGTDPQQVYTSDVGAQVALAPRPATSIPTLDVWGVLLLVVLLLAAMRAQRERL